MPGKSRSTMYTGITAYLPCVSRLLFASEKMQASSRSRFFERKSVTPAPQMQLADFKMEDVHNDVGSAIHQNDVSPNQHVRAIRRRRRQAALKVFGTGLEPFL